MLKVLGVPRKSRSYRLDRLDFWTFGLRVVMGLMMFNDGLKMQTMECYLNQPQNIIQYPYLVTVEISNISGILCKDVNNHCWPAVLCLEKD